MLENITQSIKEPYTGAFENHNLQIVTDEKGNQRLLLNNLEVFVFQGQTNPVYPSKKSLFGNKKKNLLMRKILHKSLVGR